MLTFRQLRFGVIDRSCLGSADRQMKLAVVRQPRARSQARSSSPCRNRTAGYFWAAFSLCKSLSAKGNVAIRGHQTCKPCTKPGISGLIRATLGPLPGLPTHAITPSSVIVCDMEPFLRFAEDSCNPGSDRPDRTVKQASTHQKDNAVPRPAVRRESPVLLITGGMPKIRSHSPLFLPNDGNFRPVCRIIS